MRRILSALALGLTGCVLPAKEPNLVLHADVRFSQAERHCMEEAAAQLDEQTDGFATVGFKYNYNPDSLFSEVKQSVFNNRVVRWTSTTPDLVEYEKTYQERHGSEFRLLGQTNGADVHGSRTIEIRLVADRLTDPHMCKLTMMHEIGHIYGLDHLPSSRGNIMHPMVISGRTDCYKREDLSVFCSLNGCDFSKMKPCPDHQPVGVFHAPDATECKE